MVVFSKTSKFTATSIQEAESIWQRCYKCSWQSLQGSWNIDGNDLELITKDILYKIHWHNRPFMLCKLICFTTRALYGKNESKEHNSFSLSEEWVQSFPKMGESWTESPSANCQSQWNWTSQSSSQCTTCSCNKLHKLLVPVMQWVQHWPPHDNVLFNDIMIFSHHTFHIGQNICKHYGMFLAYLAKSLILNQFPSAGHILLQKSR